MQIRLPPLALGQRPAVADQNTRSSGRAASGALRSLGTDTCPAHDLPPFAEIPLDPLRKLLRWVANGGALIEGVLRGHGMHFGNDLTLLPWLLERRLEVALIDWVGHDAPPVHLMYRRRGRQVAAVRAFGDFVSRLFAELLEAQGVRGPGYDADAGLVQGAVCGPIDRTSSQSRGIALGKCGERPPGAKSFHSVLPHGVQGRAFMGGKEEHLPSTTFKPPPGDRGDALERQLVLAFDPWRYQRDVA